MDSLLINNCATKEKARLVYLFLLCCNVVSVGVIRGKVSGMCTHDFDGFGCTWNSWVEYVGRCVCVCVEGGLV